VGNNLSLLPREGKTCEGKKKTPDIPKRGPDNFGEEVQGFITNTTTVQAVKVRAVKSSPKASRILIRKEQPVIRCLPKHGNGKA